MKLISMTDFVLEQNEQLDEQATVGMELTEYHKCIAYANFLKRPLELGMFIPCDLEGNVLEEPEQKFHHMGKDSKTDMMVYSHQSLQYQEAKDRVLFEGKFKIKKSGEGRFLLNEDGTCLLFRDTVTYKWKTIMFRTIEDLLHLDLTLTDKSIEQLNN